jgi:hypothetical protein
MAAAAVKPPAPTMQPTQKPRPNPAPREEGATRKRNGQLGPFLRVLTSLWIVWHFTGVFLAALSVPVSSQLVYDIAQDRPMQWYLDALYLNQGHSFFAPEVGPGHLIRYELLDQSGRVLETGELPSRKNHWPRLRYHRHFMLADQAGLPSDDKQASDYWQRKYLEAYARHLLRINEAAYTARLQRVAHWPLPRDLAVPRQPPGAPSPLPAKKLTDPEGYEVVMEVTQRRSDLGPTASGQTLMWQGNRMGTAGRWMGGPR